jgi:hypothetical protein
MMKVYIDVSQTILMLILALALFFYGCTVQAEDQPDRPSLSPARTRSIQ